MLRGKLGRSPHGERGLKFLLFAVAQAAAGRSPHGERGLKSIPAEGHGENAGRSPHGERGLKSLPIVPVSAPILSLPPRGAWIEIELAFRVKGKQEVAPPTGSVD